MRTYGTRCKKVFIDKMPMPFNVKLIIFTVQSALAIRQKLVSTESFLIVSPFLIASPNFENRSAQKSVLMWVFMYYYCVVSYFKFRLYLQQRRRLKWARPTRWSRCCWRGHCPKAMSREGSCHGHEQARFGLRKSWGQRQFKTKTV